MTKYNNKSQSAQHGGRNQSTSNRSSSKKNKSGAVDELKGAVFDYGPARGAVDQYNKSLEDLINYVRTNYSEPDDVVNLLRLGTEPDYDKLPDPKVVETDEPEMPEELPADAGNASRRAYDKAMTTYKTEKAKYDMEVEQVKSWNSLMLKEHAFMAKKYKSNKSNAFGLVLGQCTTSLKNKLERESKWKDVLADHDLKELMKLIKGICLQANEEVYHWKTKTDCDSRLDGCRIGDSEGINNYRKRFDAEVDVKRAQYGGSLLPYTELLKTPAFKTAWDAQDEDQMAEEAEKIEESYLAYLLLKNCDNRKGKKLNLDLANDFAKGLDTTYPKTRDEAIKLLTTTKLELGTNSQQNSNSNNRRTGNAHAQQGNKQQSKRKKTCLNCNRENCWSSSCPFPYGFKDWPKHKQDNYLKQKGTAHAQTGSDNNNDADVESDNETDTEEKETGNAHFGTKSKKKRTAKHNKGSKGKKQQLKGSLCAMKGVSTHQPSFSFTNIENKLKADGMDTEDMKNMIGVDTMSDTNIFCNRKLVDNIFKVATKLFLTSNGGLNTTQYQCGMFWWKTMEKWWDTKTLTNIMSMALLIRSGEFIIGMADNGMVFTMSPKWNTYIKWRFNANKHNMYVCTVDDFLAAIAEGIKLKAAADAAGEATSAVCTGVSNTMLQVPPVATAGVTADAETAGVTVDIGTAGVPTAPVVPTTQVLKRVAQVNKKALLSVEENKKLFTKRQVAEAEEAMRVHATIGFPSLPDYKHIVATNRIKDCPVTLEHIRVMEHIYGDNSILLKGKTTRRKPLPVVQDYVQIPEQLINAHQGIILYADIFYINGIAFLLTISKAIQYLTIIYMKNREKKTLMKSVDEAFALYNNAGFVIKSFHADNEFECIKPELEANDIDVNICAADEHVPQAERAIRLVKERFRCLWHSCHFGRWPRVMIVKGAYKCRDDLNAFPPKGGISQQYSPRAIIEKRTYDYNKQCKVLFGSYVQAINKGDNTPEERTKSCIYMGPTPTHQVGHSLLDLKNGETITRHKVWPMHMTKEVVATVEKLAWKDGQKSNTHPIIKTHLLDTGVDDDSDSDTSDSDDESDDDDSTVPPLLERGIEYDTDSDSVYSSDEESDSDDEDDFDAESEVDEDEIEELNVTFDESQNTTQVYNTELPVDTVQHISLDESQPDQTEISSESTDSDQINNNSEVSDEINLQPTETNAGSDDTLVEPGDTGAEVTDGHTPTDPVPGLTDPVPEPLRRSTRESKPVERLQPRHQGQVHDTAARHLFFQRTVRDPATYLEYCENEAHVLANCFIQTFSLKKGIKQFGKRASDAAHDEMKQLHDRDAWIPVDISKYPPHVRRQVMQSLLFLVEKRDGRIKARHCANGSIQRNWYTKEESSSPTAYQESVMLSAAIDAKEGREVAIVDIPNAFIQTHAMEIKGKPPEIMKVRGKMAEILLEIAPSLYHPFVVFERGEPVLYLLLTKAVYGTLTAALAFYRKLRKDLEDAGFIYNKYDPCVANKMVDDSQLTIVHHVDDCKLSHLKKEVLDNVIAWLRTKYENFTAMKPSRGKVHDYLGVTLDYSVKGKVKMSMHKYIKLTLKEFQEEVKKTTHRVDIKKLKKVTTPAAEHLFDVDPEAKKLSERMKNIFHTTVAKLLFLAKRTRPDLQPAVPFLCTRVKSPDEDDWKKLLRVLKWLDLTWDEVLTLECDGGKGVMIVKWFPDAAFAVHADYKSHTGIVGTLGKGAFQTISSKQKLNTRSSTEAELVAADDCMSPALWTRLFLMDQGYECQTTIYQDNTSSIHLEKNGPSSSGKRTRHLNIRFFYITDCHEKGYFRIEYCPTEDMRGDYPSKPLQGKLFTDHNNFILNKPSKPNKSNNKPNKPKRRKKPK